MTHPSTVANTLDAAPSDRNAAAGLLAVTGASQSVLVATAAGERDTSWFVQAFARHRIAVTADLLSALESAEDALAEHCPGLTYLLDDVITPAIAKARGEVQP